MRRRPHYYQDRIWSDPDKIAHDLVELSTRRHDKRAVSTIQYREKEKTKKNQGNFAEVYKFVAEQEETKQ
jgi:hypothetical protein